LTHKQISAMLIATKGNILSYPLFLPLSLQLGSRGKARDSRLFLSLSRKKNAGCVFRLKDEKHPESGPFSSSAKPWKTSKN
jgi:hypothetical protein